VRIAYIITGVFAALVCGGPTSTLAPTPQAARVNKTTPLILEKNEGERCVVRGWPGP
jgi:hypothetical protein